MTADDPAPADSLLQRLRIGVYGVRGRMLLQFVVAMAVVTLGSILLQRQTLQAQLDRRIAADLDQEVTELRTLVGGRDSAGRCIGGTDGDGRCAVGRDPETGRPFGDDIEAVFDTFLRRNIPTRFEVMITFVDGEPYKVPGVQSPAADAVDEALFDLATIEQPERGERETEQGLLRYLATPVLGSEGEALGVFAVAQFVDLQREILEDELRVVALMGIALFVVASVLAYIAAGRVLAPVRAVRETARTISDSDLSRRIDVQGNDEIASLARTFNSMLDRLEAAFVAQRRFVDDAGHELRTPITIIRGHLELLGDDPQEREETVSIVTEELDRMNRMVNDLLVLARAERPDFLNLAAVDLHQLTMDLFTKAKALAPRDWRLEQAAQGTVVADPQRLTQAVMQLAQNATQHTVEGDRITLGSAITAGEVRLDVADDGPGILPEHQQRIFERFARAGRVRSGEGAGLGLSIVRAIAAAHGGRIELVSAEGAGATFTVVIPAQQPAVPDTAPQEEHAT